MQVFLENNDLRVGIRSTGAELFSVVNKADDIQYMWSADPGFWAKTSPVLFPIVGTLKSNQYQYNGKTYSLSRHGFAREMEFRLTEQTPTQVVFSIQDDASTREKYPFAFRFSILYTLQERNLRVAYEVENTGPGELLFSVGGHPAFAAPLRSGNSYTDYYLKFNREEDAVRWPISAGGLIETTPEDFMTHTDRVDLRHDLFYGDAIVLKHLKSDTISLRSDKDDHGIEFHFKGFPFLGIWAARDAKFICIEPWYGIADSVDHDQDLNHKEGIETIAPGDIWTRSWDVDFF
jgi:galactose mutarotase-like enzyme